MRDGEESARGGWNEARIKFSILSVIEEAGESLCLDPGGGKFEYADLYADVASQAPVPSMQSKIERMGDELHC